ncbi:hypothetical protein ACJX0J_024420, partial [Zea mays]
MASPCVVLLKLGTHVLTMTIPPLGDSPILYIDRLLSEELANINLSQVVICLSIHLGWNIALAGPNIHKDPF